MIPYETDYFLGRLNSRFDWGLGLLELHCSFKSWAVDLFRYWFRFWFLLLGWGWVPTLPTCYFLWDWLRLNRLSVLKLRWLDFCRGLLNLLFRFVDNLSCKIGRLNLNRRWLYHGLHLWLSLLILQERINKFLRHGLFFHFWRSGDRRWCHFRLLYRLRFNLWSHCGLLIWCWHWSRLSDWRDCARSYHFLLFYLWLCNRSSFSCERLLGLNNTFLVGVLNFWFRT